MFCENCVFRKTFEYFETFTCNELLCFGSFLLFIILVLAEYKNYYKQRIQK